MRITPETGAEKLGFGAIISRLGAHLITTRGADVLDRAQPSSDLERVRTELETVGELQQLLAFDDPLPLRGVLDLRASLRQATPEGAYLEPGDLFEVRRVLETVRLLHEYLTRRRERYARLARFADGFPPHPEVERAIESVIDAQGNLRDDASSELRRIRASIVRAQGALRETLNRTLRDAIGHGYATEEQPTIRGGRMVIPVRAEAKRKVAGFVHDTSASGQTVYIEPAACLDLNNEVRELEAAERQEVIRILRDVTARVRAVIPDLQRALAALGEFDYAHARARLANEIKAVVPSLNAEGIVDAIDARNPALLVHFLEREDGAARSVIPLTVRLDDERRTLVITGPNAGGKTVALKTIGLLSVMIAHGIPVPVDEKSDLCVFERLFVDLGDEQSIEEDLSTFSSHIGNLSGMVRDASARSLVLIDEAGTGTDPDEGAALAQSVLEALTAQNARTIATTHHGALKAFAHDTERVVNGSMAFDEATLAPTYMFRAGVPGSSYAFPIARRQGLSESVLSRAEALLGTQKVSFERLLETYEEQSRMLQIRLEELDELRDEARVLRGRFEDRLSAIQQERDEVRRRALEEAEGIVREANARVERTIREIREAQAERAATQASRAELEQFSSDVRRKKDRQERRKQTRPRRTAGTESAKSEERPIGPGDRVVLDGGATPAEVIEVEGRTATLSFGSTRLRADLRRLTRVTGAEARRSERRREVRPATTDAMRSLTARSSVDVRGQRVHEAVATATRLVDDAVAANLEFVEILHGKGTGALREAIRDELSRHPAVRTMDDAPVDQGGAGITIARLA